MRKLLRRFLRDRAGTTAIEFAMISVPFIGLIGAIFETGMIYFRTAELQTATETAKRILLTHRATVGQTNQEFVNQNICTWKSSGKVAAATLSAAFDCSKVIVNVQKSSGTWSSFDTSGADVYNSTTAYNPGGTLTIPAPGEVAIVRVLYPMPVLASILGGSVFGQSYSKVKNGVSYQSSTVHMLVGMAAFRVEPN